MSISGAWITLNRSCNNRCKWCYAQGTSFHQTTMLQPMVMTLINFLSELKVTQVVLIGGEPTLFPNLTKVIQKSLEKGVRPILVTNGRKFCKKEFVRKILDSGLRDITISAKAADEFQYKQLTGADGFGEMLEGIRNLRKVAFSPQLSITITKPLIARIVEILDLFFKEGIEHISIDMAGPVISNEMVSLEDIPNPHELVRCCEETHEAMKRLGWTGYAFNISVPLCLFDQKILKELMEEKKVATCCHIQKGSGLIFDERANVIVCNHFPEYPIGKFGVDFFDQNSFMTFWHGESVETFRKKIRRYPSLKCKTCLLWNICGGGCFVKWLGFNPTEYIERR